MAGRVREALGSAQRTLRRHRKAIYFFGVVSLVSGLIIDFASVSSHTWWLEYPGMVLPVVGSVLLLVNYVTAHLTKGRLTHKEAQDEAAYGVFVYLYLGLCMITLLVLTPGVLDYIEGRTSSLYMAIPRIFVLVDLTGIPLMVYFLLIVSAIVLSFNALTKNGFTMYLKVMRGQEVPPECCDADMFFGNALSTMTWAIFAYLFFAYAFFIVLGVVGIRPVLPDFVGDTPGVIYSLSRASVWEELNDRVLFVGVPLLAIDHIFRRDRALKLRQYILGGGMKFGYVESGAALFSAIVFSLSHVEYWDVYKVPPTFIAGLFLSYMFMKFGLYASIMMHFTVNLYDIPFMATGEEIPIPLVFALLGLISFLYYGKSLWGFVAHDLIKLPRRPEPAPEQIPLRGPDRQGHSEVQRFERTSSANNRWWLIIVAGMLTLLSACTMLWMAYDIATSPEYGGLETTWDKVSYLPVVVPNLLSVAVLAASVFRPEARLMMVAATLAGFSFLGPLVIVAHIALWIAHRRYELPWKYVRARSGTSD